MSKPAGLPPTGHSNEDAERPPPPSSLRTDIPADDYRDLVSIIQGVKGRIKDSLPHTDKQSLAVAEASARMLLNLTRALSYYHAPTDDKTPGSKSNDPLDVNI